MATLPEALAAELWQEAEPLLRRPLGPRPVLVVLAGLPLAGKTTLARTLELRAATAVLSVENDDVRSRVARRLGRGTPLHDARENFLTYRTAWDLLATALASGVSAIHDATNLTESGRRGAYEAADDAGAAVVLVFLSTPFDVREARAAGLDADRRRAHEKAGRRRPGPSRATRTTLLLDGSHPAAANADVLEAEPALAPLFGR